MIAPILGSMQLARENMRIEAFLAWVNLTMETAVIE